MFQPFERENTSTPTSFAPGVSRKLGATYPSKVVSVYDASCTTSTSCSRPNSTARSNSPSGTIAPVGLLG